jgi:uncharacterized UBP type Zn finger protein
MAERCEHFGALRPVRPTGRGCAECIAMGSKWTELRVCLTCGHVGCCEDSRNAHALAHFKATGHPVIAPYDGTAAWTWCYVHRRYYDAAPEAFAQKRSRVRSLLRRLVRRA